ncbi:hypothetical protein H7E68_07890 [Clostridium gasigenes]|uniref:Fe-S cluster assembly iron-binding protein IscA n=2 Tax=Clostridium gasigenes TaxID=94869 RepID=A0A7X0SBN0_9CLOT|nr:hypothetical protein [Clostridium gasigenes]
MNIKFNEKTKIGLLNLIENSSEDYARIKVVGNGCGKPAYNIYSSLKGDNDIEVIINDVKFIISKEDEKLCSDIEIKYDKEVYNNGFYVRMI